MHGMQSLRISCKRQEEGAPLLDPFQREDVPDGIELWYAPLEPLIPFRESLEPELSSDERKRADRFHFEKDRNRFVIGHYLLRSVLADRIGAEAHSLVFSRHRFGKPYLADFPQIEFNFSDTKDGILIGISSGAPIGVDIETLQREVDHSGVADNYFMNEEIEELARSSDPKRLFLEFWTKKEAILKASGVGIMEDVRVLQVNKNDQTVQLSHADMKALSAPEYHVHTGFIGENHVFSLSLPEPFNGFVLYDSLLL